jgi:hypothetical protein
VTVPAPGVPIELDTAAEAVPRVASPTVSDLLRAIPEVASSSGAGPAEGASTSEEPWRIVYGPLLADETIIKSPITGVFGDLVRSGPDSSLQEGPPLAWMSTKGNSYFILGDAEEQEIWAEFRALGHVMVLIFLPRHLVP